MVHIYKMREKRDRSVCIVPEMVGRVIENLIYGRGSIDALIVKGLEQTAEYMALVGSVDGVHLIIFDRTQQTPWDERIWHRLYEYAGRTIVVWGMLMLHCIAVFLLYVKY